MKNCPVCKNEIYLDPSLKLLVPPCFHKLCTTCIDRIFRRGTEKCPEENCFEILKKGSYTIPRFEKLSTEKENRIRTRLKLYKKERDFFETQEEFDNYLEELELFYDNFMSQETVQKQESMVEEFIKKTRKGHTKKFIPKKKQKNFPIYHEEKKICFVEIKGEVEDFLLKQGLKTKHKESVLQKVLYDAFNPSLLKFL